MYNYISIFQLQLQVWLVYNKNFILNFSLFFIADQYSCELFYCSKIPLTETKATAKSVHRVKKKCKHLGYWLMRKTSEDIVKYPVKYFRAWEQSVKWGVLFNNAKNKNFLLNRSNKISKMSAAESAYSSSTDF